MIHIDRQIYDKMQLCLTTVNSVRDLEPGCLLVNYPTAMVSRNSFESVLERSEVFLITDVSELGIRGVTLNPYA